MAVLSDTHTFHLRVSHRLSIVVVTTADNIVEAVSSPLLTFFYPAGYVTCVCVRSRCQEQINQTCLFYNELITRSVDDTAGACDTTRLTAG